MWNIRIIDYCKHLQLFHEVGIYPEREAAYDKPNSLQSIRSRRHQRLKFTIFNSSKLLGFVISDIPDIPAFVLCLISLPVTKIKEKTSFVPQHLFPVQDGARIFSTKQERHR
jgi:hypothetical protein